MESNLRETALGSGKLRILGLIFSSCQVPGRGLASIIYQAKTMLMPTLVKPQMTIGEDLGPVLAGIDDAGDRPVVTTVRVVSHDSQTESRQSHARQRMRHSREVHQPETRGIARQVPRIAETGCDSGSVYTCLYSVSLGASSLIRPESSNPRPERELTD